MAGGSTDTVPARLTPGEFVIKRGSAEMLGLPFLRQLNAVSDSAAHENIDALMAMAELSNMKPMKGGGYVENSYQYGGKVESAMGMRPRTGLREMHYQDGDLVENKKGALSTLVDGLFAPIGAGKQQSAGLLGKYRHDANEEVVPQDITLEIPDFAKAILENRPRYDASSKAIEKAIEEEQRMLLDARKLRQHMGGFRMPMGYQGGDLVQDPNDPLGIAQRQADPSMSAGSVMQGAGGMMPAGGMAPAGGNVPGDPVLAQLQQLEAGIRQDEKNKALKFLERLQLMSLLGDTSSLDYPNGSVNGNGLVSGKYSGKGEIQFPVYREPMPMDSLPSYWQGHPLR